MEISMDEKRASGGRARNPASRSREATEPWEEEYTRESPNAGKGADQDDWRGGLEIRVAEEPPKQRSCSSRASKEEGLWCPCSFEQGMKKITSTVQGFLQGRFLKVKEHELLLR
ncbi:hypothetical protein NE237_031365 [Protea cynaroides]|uniref:Uncharacterized protein n=1 Tax=Protea cynaroides TaxID=273540 RepID=A0A9Q0L116_9MAGN|nr:hypothetical protein NE237_031365 [Protea cynaroides]